MQQTSIDQYTLIDSGQRRKLEKFGPYITERHSAQAIWQRQKKPSIWSSPNAIFTRKRENKWIKKRPLPHDRNITVSKITFKISIIDFGHLRIFSERPFWYWITQTIKKAKFKRQSPINVLNLFAYFEGATPTAVLVMHERNGAGRRGKRAFTSEWRVCKVAA